MCVCTRWREGEGKDEEEREGEEERMRVFVGREQMTQSSLDEELCLFVSEDTSTSIQRYPK